VASKINVKAKARQKRNEGPKTKNGAVSFLFLERNGDNQTVQSLKTRE
jgi:hypothetical protein